MTDHARTARFTADAAAAAVRAAGVDYRLARALHGEVAALALARLQSAPPAYTGRLDADCPACEGAMVGCPHHSTMVANGD